MAATNKEAGQSQGSGAGGRGPAAGGRGPGISPSYLYNKHDLQLLWKKTRGEKT